MVEAAGRLRGRATTQSTTTIMTLMMDTLNMVFMDLLGLATF